MKFAKIIKQKAKRLLTSLIGQAAHMEDICPYECSLADAMKDDVWEKLSTKEQETLKQQWRDYGGWCKHWCAKCGYKCVWRDFEALIAQMKKSWSMVKGNTKACSPTYHKDYDPKHKIKFHIDS